MKALWIALGILSLILGFIGVFLPLIPTTPFAILAAFFFSKGSDSLHQWLLQTKIFGGLIKDWEKFGIIRLRIKILSTSMMIMLFGYTLIFVEVPIWIKIFVSIIGVAVLGFIWTRPSTPVSND